MKWLLIVIWFADHHILPLEKFDTIEACGARAVAMLPVYRGKANLACNLDPGGPLVTELPDNVSLEWIGRRLIAIGDDLSVLPAIAAVGVAMAIPLQQPVNAQSVTCNPKKGCSLWARPDCLVLYPNLTASAADFAL